MEGTWLSPFNALFSMPKAIYNHKKLEDDVPPNATNSFILHQWKPGITEKKNRFPFGAITVFFYFYSLFSNFHYIFVAATQLLCYLLLLLVANELLDNKFIVYIEDSSGESGYTPLYFNVFFVCPECQ